MNSSSDRSKLRRQRIMSYFVEAAGQIIQSKGVSAVTIRGVSNKAGYTSATLYNYFDNLNHLIFLSAMKYMEEYNNEISNRVVGCKNSIEAYLVVCQCFCEYSFRNPEIYSLLFFTGQNGKVEEYTRQYYELFGIDEKSHPHPLSKIVNINNISRRSFVMVMDCVNDGYISHQNALDFNEIAMLIYRGILEDVQNGKLTAQSATEKNMKFYRQLLGLYINPDCGHLLVD